MRDEWFISKIARKRKKRINMKYDDITEEDILNKEDKGMNIKLKNEPTYCTDNEIIKHI